MLLPLLALVALLALLPTTSLSAQAGDQLARAWTTLANHQGLGFAPGDLDNLTLDSDGLMVGSDEAFEPRQTPPYRHFGVYTSPILNADIQFGGLRASYEAETPAGTSISVEVRFQSTSGKWSPWQELEPPGEAFQTPLRGAAVQYRASLFAERLEPSPVLRSVLLELAPAGDDTPEAEYEALVTRPTVRLFGTREGLVGRTTANGHRIVERDRFVALPSKKALNARDGRDYLVEISYNGKRATAPVWDVGPWNIKDDFWNSPREMFNDLPRFKPESHAAFYDNYNDGKDQFGRPVIYPASIDIADGTFWDDLGMKYSDWVDVTFLWIDAVAPPLVPMPKVVAKAGPIPQAIFSQAAPSPTPVPSPTPIPKTWYFAEGSTNKPFDTWLLLQNPDPEPANVKVTYMLPNGGQRIGNYALKPTSRMSLFLNQIVPNTDVSAMIESDRYILAERAMYFGQDGHDTTGAISPSKTWFFAEGSTVAPFETWILMQNPNLVPTIATLTFYKEDGSTVAHKMLIPHVSRESLMVNLVVPDGSVGTKVESELPIVAERAIYKGRKAGSDSIGATALSKTWYMAEGNTRDGYDTWLLLLNPNDTPASVDAVYMREDGAPVARRYIVYPRSRLSIFVNQEVPGARVGAKLESDVPIVAERSFFFGAGTGTHNSVAAPALSKLWYLPEGSTAKPFTENILLLNPNSATASLTVRLMKEDGASVEKKYTLKPTSRLTLEMNSILPDTAFSTRVQSDQPIVVERSMYFSDWSGGHNSMGIPK